MRATTLWILIGVLLPPTAGASLPCADVSFAVTLLPTGATAREIPLRRGLREQGFTSWKGVLDQQIGQREAVAGDPRIPNVTRDQALRYLDETVANTRCWLATCPEDTNNPECVFYADASPLKQATADLAGTWKLVSVSDTEDGV